MATTKDGITAEPGETILAQEVMSTYLRLTQASMAVVHAEEALLEAERFVGRVPFGYEQDCEDMRKLFKKIQGVKGKLSTQMCAILQAHGKFILAPGQE